MKMKKMGVCPVCGDMMEIKINFFHNVDAFNVEYECKSRQCVVVNYHIGYLAAIGIEDFSEVKYPF